MLCTIPSYLVGDARRILTMLCFATRPLKVKELTDAVAVEIKEPMGLQKDRRMQDYNDVHDICPGFIELNAHIDEADDASATDSSSTEYVQIAHFSVQEYLISDRIRSHKAAVFSLDSAAANAEIAQVCLVYLLDGDLSTFIRDKCTIEADEESFDRDEGSLDRKGEFFDRTEGTFSEEEQNVDEKVESLDRDGEGLNRDRESLDRDEVSLEGDEFTLDDLLDNYPLAKFAAESWPQQYKAMTEYSSDVHCLISKVLLQNGTNINWLSLHDNIPGFRYVRELFEEAATPVYYASLLGLHDTLYEWFDGCQMRGQEDQVMPRCSVPKPSEMINTKGGYYEYPLVAAAALGRHREVELLLDKGANVNVCGNFGTALNTASEA